MIRTALALTLAFVLAVVSIPRGAPAQTPPALPKILVAPDERGFVTETGNRFVPFGVTYFRPDTGWAPQVWKQFDASAVKRDFARLRELGANCVRVFLSYGSFYEQPGRLSEAGVRKLDEFLALAEQAGLYVQPTGPDHWEGLPEWARGDRLADDEVLAALDQFWKLLAARYRGRNVVFAWELLNEPEVRWDTEVMKRKWPGWLEKKYGTTGPLSRAWGWSNRIEFASMPVPPKDAPRGQALLDYQTFREDLADQWTGRQVAAIKAADPHALVTVGLIQWSVPVCLAGPYHYSGFRPSRQARLLDFLELHFYPLADGFYEYRDPAAEQRNLAYLECATREAGTCGKPLVIGEFGWYGGGKLELDGGRHPAATEDQQAGWCRALVRTSGNWASGWLNWGFYDHPGAGDVTERIGLLKTSGEVKAWGREFRNLAGEYQKRVPGGNAVARPALDWDRAITDRVEMKAFMERYLRAFQAESGG